VCVCVYMYIHGQKKGLLCNLCISIKSFSSNHKKLKKEINCDVVPCKTKDIDPCPTSVNPCSAIVQI